MPEYLVICIPLFNDEIQEELDEWLYVLKHTKVRADFKSPYMKQVADRLAVLNLPGPDLAAYHHYQASSLKERDRIAYAKEEGKEEGRKEGKEEGRQTRNLEIAKRMLAKGLDVALIGELTGLSEEELTSLK